MTQKNNQTHSTMIFQNDSSMNSNNFSQIFNKQSCSQQKRLSSSVEFLKSPFQQTLPLKFPKNRIIRGCEHQMLEQSKETNNRPCIKISGLKNKQSNQTIWRQQMALQEFKSYVFPAHKNQSILKCHSRSLQLYERQQNSISPTKNSKKLFFNKILQETIKNPILIGQQVKNNTKILKKQTQRVNQGLLQWKINRSVSKQHFQQKYCKKNQKNISNSNRDNIKIQDKSFLSKIITRKQRPRTYKELYNSRKIK